MSCQTRQLPESNIFFTELINCRLIGTLTVDILALPQLILLVVSHVTMCTQRSRYPNVNNHTKSRYANDKQYINVIALEEFMQILYSSST
jgi:hypothetical protein